MEGPDSTEVDTRLPPRLFATDRYPLARLNVYSKPDTLCFIRHHMKGSPEFEKILMSCFGPLFNLPASRCPSSCKLMHALICRQLVTKKKYEMWTVFGGQPLRFSLVEFGAMTGLPCGDFPEDYDPEVEPAPVSGKKTYWSELLGEDLHYTLGDVSEMLKTSTDGDRRLRLAYLLIVDGVLIANNQSPRPSFKYVEMLSDLDSFLAFPWGRESFLKTICSMIPIKKNLKHCKRMRLEDPIESFTQQLQQQTVRLKGFPLALQLLAFRSISGMSDTISDDNSSRILLNWKSETLPKQAIILAHIHAIEQKSNLLVQPLIDSEDIPDGYGDWDDEVKDRKVDFLLHQIRDSHVFKKSEWPGGHSSLPLIPVIARKPAMVHKRHIVARRKNPTQSRPVGVHTSVPSRNQPLITEFIRPSSDYSELMKQVQILSSRVLKLEKKVKAFRTSRRNKVHRSRDLLSRRTQRKSVKSPAQLRSSDQSHDPINAPTPMEVPVGSPSNVLEEFHVSDEIETNPLSPTDILVGDGRIHVWQKFEHVFGVLPPPKFAEDDFSKHSPNEVIYNSVMVVGCVGNPVFDSVTKAAPGKSFGDLTREDPSVYINEKVGPEITPDADLIGLLDPNVQGSTLKEDPYFDVQTEVDPLRNSDVFKKVLITPDSDIHTKPSTQDLISPNLQGSTPNEDPSVVEKVDTLSNLDVAEQDIHPILDNPNLLGSTPNQERTIDLPDCNKDSVVQHILSTCVDTTPDKAANLIGTPKFDTANPELANSEMSNPGQFCNGTWDKSIGNPIFDTETKKLSVLDVEMPKITDRDSEDLGEESGPADLVYVSDSSPARQRLRPILTSSEALIVSKFIQNPSSKTSNLLPIVDQSEWKVYQDALTPAMNTGHVTKCGYLITNSFLLDLGEPQKWVSTLHIEVLVSLLARRLADKLVLNRAAFIPPWLANHLQGMYRKFKAARLKSRVHYPDQLKQFISGSQTEWFTDIDTIFVPMIWDNSHWVGLVISLGLWSVEILDPNVTLFADKKVERFMAPIVEILPHLIRKFCKPQLSQNHGLKPFVYHRVEGIYKNIRSGDCGPVAMKFLEIQASEGDTELMANITDDLVDHFRRQYSFDIFQSLVAPIYADDVLPPSPIPM